MSVARQIFYVTRWATSVAFIGLISGVMAVFFPPIAVAGVIALTAALLFWTLPELRFVPNKLLRKLFFILVVVEICVPNYYAIYTNYLPWISVRKLFELAAILTFCLVVAGSKSAREKIAGELRSNRLLVVAVIGFLVTMFLSIVMSVDKPTSLKGSIDALLIWYIPLAACILIVRSEEDVITILKVITISAIVVLIAGVIEFVLQRRYYFDIIPKSILDPMLSNNPAVYVMYYTSQFRNGLYRAASIFSVSLSLGEFAAMVSPIAAYFVYGTGWRARTLGIVTFLCSLLALYVSGSRGGYIGFLAAMPFMLILWIVRHSKLSPDRMLPGIVGAIFAVVFVTILVLIATWPRLHNMVLGADEDIAGARALQWNMARPHIAANPVTGNGLGTAPNLIGYGRDTLGRTSVDSYIITLLVDLGVPGLICFYAMIGLGIWLSARAYLTDVAPQAEVFLPIVCSLIAFITYRTTLSQVENHMLVFILIGAVFVLEKRSRDRRGTIGYRSLWGKGPSLEYAKLIEVDR